MQLFCVCFYTICHIKWVEMTPHYLTDTGDDLQIWRTAVNILNNQWWTADKEWPSDLGNGWTRSGNSSS